MRILAINPNSTQSVTDGISTAVAAFRSSDIAVDCITLPEGPPGIETQTHIDQVIPPLVERIATEAADAYVIACFSDPGLSAAQSAVDRPVFGIGECAYRAAIEHGDRFGIISILDGSIPRHRTYLDKLDLSEWCAGDRAIGLGVTDLGNDAYPRMEQVGRTLIDTDGATALILGCAGMAALRETLEQNLGVPVIDPCQAAVAAAIRQLTAA